MKYGIQHKKGKAVKYVSSTRGGHLTDDITNIALFVQEKSAVDALKELRRGGVEGDGNLEVVEIDFVIRRITHVPRPKAVEGFVLRRGEGERSLFCGTKTLKNREQQWGDQNHFGNKERATVFATEAQAGARRDALVVTAENYRDYCRERGPGYGGYRDASQAEEYFASEMQRHEAVVEAMKSLEITPHAG